jgi:hypothetical protein
VAKFAELHGGRAWVQERLGGGASFRVLLAYDPTVEDILVLEDAGRPDAQRTETDSSSEDSQA